jgi:hypothetical protein
VSGALEASRLAGAIDRWTDTTFVLHHLFRDYADPFLCRRAYHHAGVIPAGMLR